MLAWYAGRFRARRKSRSGITKSMSKTQHLFLRFRPIVATYDVYVGGFHLLTADILFEESAHKYHAQVKGKTYGIWYKVFPWDTELNAEGRIKSDRFMPAEYATHDLWGKKPRQ